LLRCHTKDRPCDASLDPKIRQFSAAGSIPLVWAYNPVKLFLCRTVSSRRHRSPQKSLKWAFPLAPNLILLANSFHAVDETGQAHVQSQVSEHRARLIAQVEASFRVPEPARLNSPAVSNLRQNQINFGNDNNSYTLIGREVR
jgi:hypothetical protein